MSSIPQSDHVLVSTAESEGHTVKFEPQQSPASYHGLPNFSSRTTKEDDSPNQDSLSFARCGRKSAVRHWSLANDDAFDKTTLSGSEPVSPDVQMLSFSFSRQLVPSTASHQEVTYHTLPEFPAVQDHDHTDLDFTSAQDFQNYSTYLEFPMDSDSISIGRSSYTEDRQISAATDVWTALPVHHGNFHGSTIEMSPNIFHKVPASPPLTDASNDVCISSCSQSGFQTIMHPDDAFLEDAMAHPVGSQSINLGDPLFPLTPPLCEQDPNRIIRNRNPAARPILSTDTVLSQGKKPEQESFPSVTVEEPLRPASKEGPEARNPRDHPYYTMTPHSDGKYYCPYATSDKPCNHPPTTQKCAYHKYLDSHLKPYRCKVPACLDAQLQFSSNACLFRHEREAHGFHGHGDNPHLCLFEGCDRSIPGYGFPRRWNLFDHMRRVHDYVSSERSSSPENTAVKPTNGQVPRKKDLPGRRRRGPGASGAQPMKRTRSTQSSSTKAVLSITHHGQRLQNAERSYYNCRSRLLEELVNITPRDSAMHEKVNASLQELITLGLNYRHIEATQATGQTCKA